MRYVLKGKRPPMTTMARAFQPIFSTGRLKTFMVMLLACMLMAMGTAQVRVKVIQVQAEAGLQRILENEVHSSGPALQLQRQEKLGRRPFEHVERLAPQVHGPGLRRFAGPARMANGRRGPPYAQRGPPLTA